MLAKIANAIEFFCIAGFALTMTAGFAAIAAWLLGAARDLGMI